MNGYLNLFALLFLSHFASSTFLEDTSTAATTTEGWTPNPHCPYPSDKITYDYVPGNCTAFYECDHGNRYLFNCPGNLEWNHFHDYCDYPENVDCSRASTPKPVTTTESPDPVCAGKEDGTFLPNIHNCHQFFECVGGHAMSFDCPENLEWNKEAKTCDYPAHANCTPVP